jgi:hypothetical protein
LRASVTRMHLISFQLGFAQGRPAATTYPSLWHWLYMGIIARMRPAFHHFAMNIYTLLQAQSSQQT